MFGWLFGKTNYFEECLTPKQETRLIVVSIIFGPVAFAMAPVGLCLVAATIIFWLPFSKDRKS